MKGFLKSGILYVLSVFAILASLYGAYQVYTGTLDPSYLVALFWILAVLLLLWYGNSYLTKLLDGLVSWMDYPSKRFFLQIVFSILYSLLCINLTYYLFKLSINQYLPDFSQVIVLNIYGLLFVIPILSIHFGVYFMTLWKKSETQSSRLKEEHLRSQLEMLRLQIDPHFLFNSLNVLAGLIDKDKNEAQDFLDKFANVYRYVLQNQKEDVVPLQTELEFVNAYIHLLKKRFGSALAVSMNIPQEIAEAYAIPPLSLQMLIENAVKHNVISKEIPLHIQIDVTDKNWMLIKNNYQPLENSLDTKLKTGLENIRKRYQYLSGQSMAITANAQYFCVKLPLLEIEE